VHAVLDTESTPAGRVPPDALLFVQTATKSKQKTPCPPGGDVRRGELEEITTFVYIRWLWWFSSGFLICERREQN
jgi:hypothetical protein